MVTSPQELIERYKNRGGDTELIAEDEDTESALVESQPDIAILPPKVPEENSETSEMRGIMTSAVKEDFDEIVAGQIELAKGLHVKEYVRDRKTGEFKTDPATGIPLMTKVFLRPPDREVGKYLIDQVIGKAKETKVMEGRVNFILDD